MLKKLKDQKIINLIFFSILLFQFSLISAQDIVTEKFTDEQVLLSFGETVFIVNADDTKTEIKRFNERDVFETIGSHDTIIKKNKTMVKLTNTSFVLFGTDAQNNLYYQVHIQIGLKEMLFY